MHYRRGLKGTKVDEFPANLRYTFEGKHVMFEQFGHFKAPRIVMVVSNCTSIYNRRAEVRSTPSQ